MNFLSHALPHLGLGDADAAHPLFVLGTGLPDLLSVADRRVRLREKMLRPHTTVAADEDDPDRAALCRGVLRHLDDDRWFHGTAAFAEVTAVLGVSFRERCGPGDGFRSGFVGHVVCEMLLDATLADRYPDALPRYYDRLSALDPAAVQDHVNAVHPVGTDKLADLLPGFVRSRFLEDYATDAGVAYRLGQVLKRVRLPALPPDAAAVIADARVLVAERARDLLPPEHYPWPG